ncbi:hypothetical protein L208DRAFT_1390557 [Tricholoma matsutake]|nr:hypothetical protein L208DRAFT_1390557 [Tricholoma matsutake 945]
MDGSDGYFTDDIVFDEEALAVLDNEEQKYLSQTVVSFRPPTKRQRTESGWNPGLGHWRSQDEIEDLPEISLRDDGSYRVNAATSNIALSVAPVKKSVARASALQHPTVVAQGVQPNSRNLFVSEVQPHTHIRPPSLSQRQPHVVQQSLVSSRKGSGYVFSSRASSYASSSASTSPIAVGKSHLLQEQVEELRRQLDKVSKENEKIQAALKEATDVRFAKEGEVTVLRKNIEKTAQDHAAHLAKLKSAKDEADARQMQMQKEMKEEVERLKTQFIFKQQELEASIRKPPLSIRPKKVFKEPPSTPLRIPSQIRAWNHHGTAIGPSRSFVHETPIRSRSPGNAKEIAKMAHLHKSPETFKKPNMLPGFQNAFMDSTPSQRRVGKGKQREIEDVLGDNLGVASFPDPASPPTSPTRYPRDMDTDVQREVLDFFEENDVTVRPEDISNRDVDIEMAEEVHNISEQMEDVGIIEYFDWKTELNRIILMHSLPSSATLTFQTLLGAPVMSGLPTDLALAFSSDCARVLEVVANTSEHIDFAKAAEQVARSFVSMVPILNAANSLLPLAALLNLLTVLVFALPAFVSTLLSHHMDDGNSRILVHVCEVIQTQLDISKEGTLREELGREIISLVQALSFNVNDDLLKKLVFFAHNRPVLMTLLHPIQPSWLLAQCGPLLVLLATHRPLCRALLSMPDTDPAPEDHGANPSRIHVIERLCSHLVDTSRDVELQDFKACILTCFAQISISQPDAHIALLASTAVIPSLVVYLTRLTTPIWEDSEELVSSSPDTIALAIRKLNQTLSLLHHLVFGTNPIFNLRHKLYSTHYRPFNGLTHMFIVTFGRLCYADLPGWVDEQGRHDLLLSTDIARELLDLVVDGPEADSIWQAYQFETENETEDDVEEMEAKLLGDIDKD